ALVRAVVEAFRSPGCNFLLPESSEALDTEIIIDISHESLIRQWLQLRQWTREEFQSGENYRHLVTTARRWNRGEASLWAMPELGTALAWRERECPNVAWAKRYGDDFELANKFLDESESAEWERRERARFEAEEAANRRVAEEREAAARRLLEEREAAARRVARRTRYAAVALAILAGIAGILAFISIRAAMVAEVARREAAELAIKAEAARESATEVAGKAQLARDEATSDRARAVEAQLQAEAARMEAERARNAAVQAGAQAETNFGDAQRRLQ